MGMGFITMMPSIGTLCGGRGGPLELTTDIRECVIFPLYDKAELVGTFGSSIHRYNTGIS